MYEHFHCIYCLEDKPASSFTKADHVIPQSFGAFKNNLTLQNTVCDDCNQYFGDQLELALARDSFEGLSRYEFGVKAPDQFKSVGKKTRITTKIAEGPWKGSFAYREYSQQQDQVVIKPLPQIRFLQGDGSGYLYYPLSEVPDKKTLDSLGFDLSRPASMRILGADTKDAIGVLETKGIPFKIGGEIPANPPTEKDILCEVQASIDKTIFRAVAKIAFNYLAYWEGATFARQSTFNPIRDFVREGRQPSHPLVIVRNEPVLEDERGTDKRRLGHLITTNWAVDGVSIVAHVSLMNWAKYSISLAREFPGKKMHLTRGHFFNVFDHEILELEIHKRDKET